MYDGFKLLTIYAIFGTAFLHYSINVCFDIEEAALNLLCKCLSRSLPFCFGLECFIF
jgi:hypothetical protein